MAFGLLHPKAIFYSSEFYFEYLRQPSERAIIIALWDGVKVLFKIDCLIIKQISKNNITLVTLNFKGLYVLHKSVVYDKKREKIT